MQKNSINSRFPLQLLAALAGLAALVLLALLLQQPREFHAEPEATILETVPRESLPELTAARKKAVVKVQTTESEAPAMASEERHGWPATEEIFRFFQQINQQKAKRGENVSRVRVFLKEQIAAAYGQKDGQEILLRVFPCSSGYYEGHTPLGQFRIGVKNVENVMFDGSIGRYSCQISGNILFHSLTSYNGNAYSGLQISDINAMGMPASHGCVRLYAADAKWLFDRMPSGTLVEILSERGEIFRDLPDHVHYLRLKEGAPTWDPSDPSPENPYMDFETFKQWVLDKPWEYDGFAAPAWPQSEPVNPEPQVLPVEPTEEFRENVSETTIEPIPSALPTTAPSNPAQETYATVMVERTSAKSPTLPSGSREYGNNVQTP